MSTIHHPRLSARFRGRASVTLLLGALLGPVCAPRAAGAVGDEMTEPAAAGADEGGLPVFRIQQDPDDPFTTLFRGYDPLAAWLWAADNGFARQMYLSPTGTLTVYAPDGRSITIDPAAGTITATQGNATVALAGMGPFSLPPPGGGAPGSLDLGNGASVAAAGGGAVSLTASGAVAASVDASGLKLPNGNHDLPSLTFAADPRTGLFLAGKGVLAIATAGEERLRINAAGNVSIGNLGNATAGDKLVVAGNLALVGAGSGIKFPDGSTLTTANLGGTGAAPAPAAGGLPGVTTLGGTTALANATVQTVTASNIATFNGYANFQSGVTMANGLNVAKGNVRLAGDYLSFGTAALECDTEGALSLQYVSPDVILFRATPANITWKWQENYTSGTARNQMVLANTGNLTVYDATGASSKTLNVNPGNGTADASLLPLTSSTPANLTIGTVFGVTGATRLTVSGNSSTTYEALRVQNVSLSNNAEARMVFTVSASSPYGAIGVQRDGSTTKGILKLYTGNATVGLKERVRVEEGGSFKILKSDGTTMAMEVNASGNTTFSANTTVTFNGTVQFAAPYGDIGMGIYGN